jgi:uncharacterized protein YbaR (Trm112 family)
VKRELLFALQKKRYQKHMVQEVQDERRSFDLDVLACPRCGGRLRVIATIQAPVAVRTILAHLGPSGGEGAAGTAFVRPMRRLGQIERSPAFFDGVVVSGEEAEATECLPDALHARRASLSREPPPAR